MKRWFNRRFPYYRVCLKRGCWRGQTNQYRCHRHQNFDVRDYDRA